MSSYDFRRYLVPEVMILSNSNWWRHVIISITFCQEDSIYKKNAI
jgi:hypothetical protein